MLKLVWTDKSNNYYGFGITAENVRRLKARQPIEIDLVEMGGQGKIMIFYGETEQTLYEELSEFIGPDTKVHIDPRLK